MQCTNPQQLMRETWSGPLASLSSTVCTKAYTNHCVWALFQTTHTTTTLFQGLVLNHLLNSLNFFLLLVLLTLGKWFSISAFVLPLGLWVERPYKSRPLRGVGDTVCVEWVSVWEHCLRQGSALGHCIPKGGFPEVHGRRLWRAAVVKSSSFP